MANSKPINWAYPFKLKSAGANPLEYLSQMAKANSGFYPCGDNGLWHGGVHFDQGTAAAFDQSSVACIADGEVIAYRINKQYPTTDYPSLAIPLTAPFSSGFVLVKHTLQPPSPEPTPNSTGTGTGTGNTSTASAPTLTIFSLYMHLQDWATYQDKTELLKPAFWQADSYVVNTRTDPLTVRSEPRDKTPSLGTLSKGSQVRVSGSGGYLKLEQVLSGNTEPALTPNPDGTLPGYIAAAFLKPNAQPKTLDSVVLLDPPAQIKAGELIGHLGTYQNHNGAAEPLLHLEVFSCEDVPSFISQSRAWAAQLPAKDKTLLKVHKGASLLAKHRPDISATKPPVSNPSDPKVGVNLLIPQALLDGLPATHKISVNTPASSGLPAKTTQWWHLENLLADEAGNPISGWLAEEDLITTRHSPWEWEGFQQIEETGKPIDKLAYNFNARGLLTPQEQENYQAQINKTDGGPIVAATRLYQIVDSNNDGVLTSAEIRSALNKPWQAQVLSQLITKYESEWFWNAAKWNELDPLLASEDGQKNLVWEKEKERIEQLSWWGDLADKQGISADGKAWHFSATSIIQPQEYTSNSSELRIRAFMRMIRVGEGTTGQNGYEKLFGGSSFIKDHNRDYSDHPQIKIKASGYVSSAAGAYQIMGYTWTDGQYKKKKEKYQITDFSPEAQDKFCVILLKHATRGNALNMIIDNKIKEAIESCSWIWASLPPGRYGQPNETMDKALEYYEEFLKAETAGDSYLHISPGFLDAFLN